MKKILVSSLVGSIFVLGACSGGTSPAEEEIPEVDAGPDAALQLPPDVPPVSDGCDPNKTPAEDKCVLHESFGVFVSSSRGNDANDGTRTRPYATLSKAIEAAKASKRRVYACAELFTEPTVMLADGVSMFGAIGCTGQWAPTTEHAKLAATGSPAARANDIVNETRVEGFDLEAPEGVAPGGSSIGLIAQNANGLHFVNARITARAGARGADGAAGIQLAQTEAFNGRNEVNTYACGTSAFDCVSSRKPEGGVGICVGAAGFVSGSGGAAGGSCYHKKGTNGVYVEQHGDPIIGKAWCPLVGGSPRVATAETAPGASGGYRVPGDQSSWDREYAGYGHPGRAGENGAVAAAMGTLSLEGYVPADGTAGTNGAPGQGGGGGSGDHPSSSFTAAHAIGPSGSGGGAGGCPGLAGTAGTGGGASIAVLSKDSLIRFDATIVAAASGGRGGAGTLGSDPTPGGRGGSVYYSTGNGGNGGRGGLAGWSGHGGSGPSLGIAWSGTQPALSPESTVVVATAQEGQPAVVTDDKTIPAAPPGIAAVMFDF